MRLGQTFLNDFCKLQNVWYIQLNMYICVAEHRYKINTTCLPPSLKKHIINAQVFCLDLIPTSHPEEATTLKLSIPPLANGVVFWSFAVIRMWLWILLSTCPGACGQEFHQCGQPGLKLPSGRICAALLYQVVPSCPNLYFDQQFITVPCCSTALPSTGCDQIS